MYLIQNMSNQAQAQAQAQAQNYVNALFAELLQEQNQQMPANAQPVNSMGCVAEPKPKVVFSPNPNANANANPHPNPHAHAHANPHPNPHPNANAPNQMPDFMEQLMMEQLMGQGLNPNLMDQLIMGQGLIPPFYPQNHPQNEGLMIHMVFNMPENPEPNPEPKPEPLLQPMIELVQVTPTTSVKTTLAPNSWATPCNFVDAQPAANEGTIKITEETEIELPNGTQFTFRAIPNVVFTVGPVGTRHLPVNGRVTVPHNTLYLPRDTTTGVPDKIKKLPLDCYFEVGTLFPLPKGTVYHIGEEQNKVDDDFRVVTLV